jgi:hypothetical protein
MIGVIYLARGKDANWGRRLMRFVDSYIRHPAGIKHQLYVIYKEFDHDLEWAIHQFDGLGVVHNLAYVDVNSYAGGSFLEASYTVKEQLICPLASSSEIMHDNWLARLYEGYMSQPDVGLVCCSGSYGFIAEFFPELTYPNPHIRNLSFLMDRDRYQTIAKPMPFTSKIDDLAFEHGPNSLTYQVLAMGKQVLVVEKERIRAPHEWGGEGGTTYRGNGDNILVHDKGTRDHRDL